MKDKSEQQRKTRPLKIRLTPEAYAKLEALAAASGETLGGWIAAQIEAHRAPRLDRRDVRGRLAERRRAAAGERT